MIERVGRYGGNVGSWSSQPVAAQTTAGNRQLGGERTSLAADGAIALAPGGYQGNGAGNGGGNGNGGGHGNGNGGGNGTSSQPARSASGWFRGRPGGGADGPAGAAGFGEPRWGNGRNPADIVAQPAHGDQTTAGLPVRVPRANLIPGRAPAGPSGTGTGPAPEQSGTASMPSVGGAAGAAGAGGTGASVTQAGLPIRGSDPGGSGLPTRGPARTPGPAGPGGRAAGGNGSQSLPQRSPDHARNRLAGFQRGTRRAETQTGQPGQAPRAGEGSER